MAKAIDLEKELWNAANELRGAVSENNYKNYILPLVFLKHLKKNLQLDWTKKEDARAAIRLAVKKELRGKVPFSELDNLLKEVIEQAEGQYKDWPVEA